MGRMPWAPWAGLLFLCAVAATGTGTGDCDDVSSLDVSLLQSSLKLSRSQDLGEMPRTEHGDAKPGRSMMMLFASISILLASALRLLPLSNEKGVPEMAKILIFVFWMSWFQYFSGDPFDAFVESMTQCPWPSPHEGHCPSGSRLQGSICVPEERSSPQWSLSVHCAEKSTVLSQAARVNGMNASTSSAIGMLTVLMAGACMDRMGRRPVIRFFLLMSIGVKLLLTLSCFLSWPAFVVAIIVQNVFEVMSAAPVYPALNCMISDLNREDEQQRGDCFSALEMWKNMASLLALVAGYPVLRAHLTSYFPFWASLALFCTVATVYFWNLPETLDRESSRESDRWSSRMWSSLVEGLRCCVADPFLGQYLVIWAAVTLAVNGAWGLSTMYLQSFIGMEQANASVCRAVWFMALLFGSALSAAFMRRGGVYVVHAVALLVMAGSWGLCALGGIFPQHAAFLFWSFGVVSFGLAFGVLSPCFAQLVSAHAPPERQGQVFGLAIVVGTLLGMPLGPLWSQVFFDPSAQGWRATLPWMVSAALLGLLAVWFSIISWKR